MSHQRPTKEYIQQAVVPTRVQVPGSGPTQGYSPYCSHSSSFHFLVYQLRIYDQIKKGSTMETIGSSQVWGFCMIIVSGSYPPPLSL